MKISHFSVKHPTIIAMILIALIVFAGYSFSGIPLEFLSDINEPSVRIVTVYPGASATDVEADVTKILEDNFVTLPNYKSMSSQSNNSYSMIIINFVDGADPYEQLPEIRYRISQLVKDLPPNIQGEPSVFVGGASMLPVISFTIEGGRDIAQLTSYVENELLPLVSHIQGVSRVTILNGKKLEVNVNLRLDDLAAKGISVATVYQVLQAGNVKLPIGEGEYQGKTIDVRYEGNFQTLSDIKSLPVGMYDNVIIKVGDVADVTLTEAHTDYYVDSLEDSLLVVQISKRLDGNVVDISKELNTILEEERLRKGNAITFNVVSDDSKTTLVALKSVVLSGLVGLLMAVFVILIFLGDARATIIIGLSIPISILITLIEMRLFNISLNVLSITGLVVALGMIVDGSIVMIEQVYQYYYQRNRPLQENILLAADGVGPSIFASVMTSVVVYLPLVFLQGLIGSILFDTSIVLIFALTSSLLVAIAVVTFLMDKILKPVADVPKERIFDRVMNTLRKWYKTALDWCLNYPKFIIFSAILFLVFSIFTVTAVGFTFVPSIDTGEFDIYMKYPQGHSLDMTREKTIEAMALVKEATPEAQSIVIYSGMGENLLGEYPANEAHINVVLNDANERERSVHQIMLEIQKILSAQVVDCTTKVSNGGIDRLISFATSGGDYGLTLISEDLDLLYSEAKRIEEEIQRDPGVVSTSLNSDFDSSTLVLDMSHDFLNSLGVNSYEAGITSIILFNGIDAGTYHHDDGQSYNIRLQSDVSDEPITPDSIAKINIFSGGGEEISFASLANIEVERAVSTINRRDRVREITVNAKLVSEDTAPINTRMNNYLKQNPLADGVSSQAAGIIELINDAITPMVTAILIAIFLIFTVMVIQFENFVQPIIVMATIPFCIIGVILSLLFFGTSMSLISLMGFLALSGLVVNNGIILIDNFNSQRKAEGDTVENLRSIIILGSATRLRPILMTTLSTMFGVIPMAIATGVGSELYAPLGQSIAGGLITSTIISLFIIPIIYYNVEKRRLRLKAVIEKRNGNNIDFFNENGNKETKKDINNNTVSLKELDANDIVRKDSSKDEKRAKADIEENNTEERKDIIIDKTPPVVPLETDSKEEEKKEEYIHPEPILFGEVEEAETTQEVDDDTNLTRAEESETTQKVEDDINLTGVIDSETLKGIEDEDTHRLNHVETGKTTEKVEDNTNLQEIEQKEINKLKKEEDEKAKERLIKLLIQSRYQKTDNSSNN